MGQSEFFEDRNDDGVADGLQVDRNADGRPDFLEGYLRGMEWRMLISSILAGLGALGLMLLADWIGNALGWH